MLAFTFIAQMVLLYIFISVRPIYFKYFLGSVNRTYSCIAYRDKETQASLCEGKVVGRG